MTRDNPTRLEQLENELAAYRAQSRLLESFVAMARSPVHDKLILSSLQTALDVISDLADAEKGSLFLLDDETKVTESILARGEAAPEVRAKLIGSVMTKGLAGWVLRNLEIGLIKDTATDDRWLNLPDQPYQVRSVLAVPIIRTGKTLGLVTLLHSKPNHFNPTTAQLVQAACDQIGLTLENVKLYEQVDAYSKALDAELEKGRQIQRDFLPRQLPSPAGWDIAVFFEPTWQVSGDFYDIFELDNGLLILIVADVSDKGVGAALFMALFRTLIRAFSSAVSTRDGDPSKPDEVLKAVSLANNYMLRHHSDGGMFATLFMAVLDPATGRLDYINAGHEPAFIRTPTGALRRLEKTGPAVGLVEDAHYERGTDQLDLGELLFGCTDGVTEAMSADKKMFTRGRLEEILATPLDNASRLIDDIRAALNEHTSCTDQNDDITMICVMREAKP